MKIEELISGLEVEHAELKEKLIKHTMYTNTKLDAVSSLVHRNLLLKQELAMQSLLQCLTHRIMILKAEVTNA